MRGKDSMNVLVLLLQGLEFGDLCVDVKDKRILWNISGHASHGRVLAIMGPSGVSYNSKYAHNVESLST